jgi:tRNA A-37 threonylcarbamoyl transferase component Bud32
MRACQVENWYGNQTSWCNVRPLRTPRGMHRKRTAYGRLATYEVGSHSWTWRVQASVRDRVEKPFSRDPAALTYRAVVGAWRVVGWAGQGSYGVVYCVQRVDDPEAGLFALKIALEPEDERLLREAELLACLEHPNVPRLHDSGWWKPVDGVSFPFLVMDWVAGAHLYEWAEHHKIRFRQAARVLAQVLRALEALHAMGGVHRDVKGSNVLVTEEGRAVLTDFGLGTYRGASALTRQAEPLGTPQYLTPQALLHREKYWGRAQPRYEASAADDVFALGMTAWRLMTGAYPPHSMGPEEAKDDPLGGYGVKVSPEDLRGVSPEVAAAICRMLSDDPAARGSTGEAAQVFEEEAAKAEIEEKRLTPQRVADGAAASAAQPIPVRRVLAWKVGLAAAVAGLVMALDSWESEFRRSVQEPGAVAREARAEDRPDSGTAGMAQVVLPTRVGEEPPHVSEQQGLRLNLPDNPLPNQRRPPCSKREIEIKGGCWVFLAKMEPPCGPRIYEWRQGCYWPAFDSAPPPTSGPP